MSAPVKPAMTAPFSIETFIPGGVLPDDHWHQVICDDTCSRCRKAIAEDEAPRMIWSGDGSRMLVYCETCLGGPHDGGCSPGAGDLGAQPVECGDEHRADPDALPATPEGPDVTEDTRNYLIWSNEHRAWWGPGYRGYVQIISHAGRYKLTEATVICTNANAYLSATAEPNEVMLLAPEELPAVVAVANAPGLTEDPATG
jgi:hypothetical protein